MTKRPATVQLYQTRSGPMLALAADMYVTRSLALYGEYCPAEARMLRQIVMPGMTVVEVGANMGTHSVDLARACAPGPFYAFEPQPRVFQVLCANLALADVANALAYPDALGEADGEARVPVVDYGREGNFGGLALAGADRDGIAVRVRPLDALALPACGLLKIDVEGFEPAVLRGAADTIRRCRPVIYVENDRADQQGEVIALLAALGYRMFWHTPALFDPGNFRGATENVFPGIVSVNMLCLPREADHSVDGATEIDPADWQSPVALRR